MSDLSAEDILREHEQQTQETTMVSLQVELIWPERDSVIGNTQELSDTGVTVNAGFESLPPPGTILLTRLTCDVEGGDAPIIRARVTQAGPKGLALEFLTEEDGE